MASRKAWMKPNNEAVGDTNAAPRIIHGVDLCRQQQYEAHQRDRDS